MAFTREQVLEKVEALLRKTTDNGCTEEEANAAAEKAQQLLTEHKLSMAEAIKLSPEQAETVTQDSFTFEKHPEANGSRAGTHWTPEKIPAWKLSLAATVAKGNYCRMLWARPKAIYIGKQTDITVATMTCSWLLELLPRLVRQARKDAKRQGIPVTRAFGHSFYYGAISELRQRYARAMSATVDTQALVVVSETEIEDFIQETFGRLSRTSSRRRNFDRAGDAAGHEAGATVGLARPGQLANRERIRGAR